MRIRRRGRFVNILQGTDTDMVTTFKSKYIDRLREYYYVGGMPEVVQTYVENEGFLIRSERYRRTC